MFLPIDPSDVSIFKGEIYFPFYATQRLASVIKVTATYLINS
ncbi:hypothetical protein HMPREF0880_02691 [Yokenella regensburgei ATCC 43003]|nr:hypothetical protein HMPREF0880_02691 [Yokenella regensburgei ATCC 43003]